MPTTWEGLGRRLQLTREQAAITQEETANELGVTPSAISQYESGKRRVDALTLDHLARLYGVPVSYLLGQDRSKPEWEEILQRQSEELSTAGKRGISELIEKIHQFEELFRVTGSEFPSPPHPPFESLPPRRFTDRDVATWAERSRRHFDLGNAPLPGIRSFLAARGYQTFSISFGNGERDLSGLYFQHPELGSIIALNEDEAYTRRHFTMAHEFAHGLFHYHVPAILCRSQSTDPYERFADRFAAHFLMPSDALADRLQDLNTSKVNTPEQIIHLARYFGTSYGAMHTRLSTERLLARTDTSHWDIQPVTRARQLGYTVLDYEFGKRPLPLEDRFPRDYLDLALRALRDERLSLRRVAELLDISHLELEELLEPVDEAEAAQEEAYV